MINDDLPRLIVSGKVKIKTDVQKFEENHAFYVDGSSEHIDVVILATGLQWDTSCFSNDLIPGEKEFSLELLSKLHNIIKKYCLNCR